MNSSWLFLPTSKKQIIKSSRINFKKNTIASLATASTVIKLVLNKDLSFGIFKKKDL